MSLLLSKSCHQGWKIGLITTVMFISDDACKVSEIMERYVGREEI
jgi:hypothetical protein